VLRPVVCRASKGKDKDQRAAAGDPDQDKESDRGALGGAQGSLGDGDDPEVTFGVFAIRDLKAEEEIVLGWEWDDRHVVHELPRLLKEGYGSGR